MKYTSEEVVILLVEDDDVDAMAVERAFKRHKINNTIVRKKDGIEGLAYLKERASDAPIIVLLDLQMPRMDGRELLREIRGDDSISDTTVFVLTTSQADEDIFETYRLHVAGYMTKDNVGEEFEDLVGMLGCYWKVVHLPVKR